MSLLYSNIKDAPTVLIIVPPPVNCQQRPVDLDARKEFFLTKKSKDSAISNVHNFHFDLVDCGPKLHFTRRVFYGLTSMHCCDRLYPAHTWNRSHRL
jgi:hypothetical protein